MEWRGRRTSENVREAGGLGRPRTIAGSIGTLVIAIILWKACGIDPSVTMGTAAVAQSVQQDKPSAAPQRTGQDAIDKQFISTVLADTEDTWEPVFRQMGLQYKPPTLVLFEGAVNSACGRAGASTGPFYCPADQDVYLDTSFFRDMRTQLGVEGDQSATTSAAQNQAGDFAQAYVVAHEVGHHVQNLLGIADKVSQMRERVSESQANKLSVMMELQADCLAGIWANHTQQRTRFLQEGDIEEAMNAAEQIGDDRIQGRQRGYVEPDSFTHGSSAQRVYWFKLGLQTGDVNQCNTFGGA